MYSVKLYNVKIIRAENLRSPVLIIISLSLPLFNNFFVAPLVFADMYEY